MKRRCTLWAPLGIAVCLTAAAYLLCRASRRHMRDIYDMLREYE